ncbi:putative caffeoyl-CoA O-methyltransferase 2 [Trichoplax sp. H2]|uniref:Caffeoyl-CoA O-methyltransferase n=1 Tax=Trichoplax adhaerens TaxID=10228 RepID=B3SD90_TRIAD|nr:expressed hypothetical protein [Trichoplax adhaerens]EDV19279.1 expressed hypothetical protein [Trichoplax adhaerens]RDD40580.1 putative caffeoyl-CoA O-methyltransferase 2 [Trichoplax sp. H2]|eukprot:XP_002118203.1 expressed hypothetical protein [Trichoplax adhaerens]
MFFSPDSPIYQYILKSGLRNHPILERLNDVSMKHPCAMAATPDEVGFFQLLLQLINAKKVIEIGVFTGYTTLGMAMALPDDGKVVALDINNEFTDIALPFWKEANVEHKIDLKLQPALDSLNQLIANGESGTFDFIFIDADKTNYSNYYEKSLQLLKQNGIIAVDNTLWSGRVADPSINDASTQAIRQVNETILHDDRVQLSMLTLADGVTLVRKK